MNSSAYKLKHVQLKYLDGRQSYRRVLESDFAPNGDLVFWKHYDTGEDWRVFRRAGVDSHLGLRVYEQIA